MFYSSAIKFVPVCILGNDVADVAGCLDAGIVTLIETLVMFFGLSTIFMSIGGLVCGLVCGVLCGFFVVVVGFAVVVTFIICVTLLGFLLTVGGLFATVGLLELAIVGGFVEIVLTGLVIVVDGVCNGFIVVCTLAGDLVVVFWAFGDLLLLGLAAGRAVEWAVVTFV